MPSGHYPRDRHKNRPSTRSGYRGVIHQPLDSRGKPLRKPWKAYIRQQGQYITIGYFETAQAAARAYNRMALRIHGPETYFNPLLPLPA